ncbi:MAG: VirE protein [Bacteroidaceae bacterium]|nr:VirE protein [Bacteroidaceae bacterium]
MKFGISNNVRSRVVRECTPEMFDATLDAPVVRMVCAEIADAREMVARGVMQKEEFEAKKAELKKRLPVFTFHATFPGGRRKNDDAVPSGLAIYDLDHIPDPRGRWAEMEPRKGELGIVLAHVSPSTEGLRLVFVIPQGMTLPEAQAWMARQLGDKEYDACVKDYARCSFAVPRGYVLWVSPFLFRSFSEEIKGDKGRYRSALGEIKADSFSGVQDLKGKSSVSPCLCVQEKKSASSASEKLEYHGLDSSEIVAKYWELTGDGQPPTQGDRNTKIFDLACSLRHIFNFDRELLNRAIPNYEGFPQEEKMQCIDNALREPRKYMPMKLTKVLQALKAEHSQVPPHREDSGGAFPPMPQKLPPLIELLLSRTPDLYKPAVAHAVFPPLGAHLHRVTFRYIDNVAHEATLMNVLMAGTGAGKDCISQPINYIMADIRLRDEENLRREREWKNEVNSKGANKDKRKRPEGLVIQEIDADMTNPAFVMRTAEADGHFLYTKMNEIDQFDALRGSGRGGQQFQIMCLAFDPGNRYGQTRVGAGSVTEKVTIRFNWNASTTIQKGRRYFRPVLTDGPVSRINFCTIPEREIGSEMPVYGTYDEAFAEELRPYIERLTKATGEVECPEAYRLAMKLKEECADRARLTQSRVYENLSFRANVIAYLKACVLYVAHGCKWSKAIEEFVRWSLEYDLWCKMEFFGADIEESMSEGEAARRKPGPRNLLEMLPDTFTLKEALDVRRMAGIGGGEREARHMLAMWKSRKYVSQITDNSYQKVKS